LGGIAVVLYASGRAAGAKTIRAVTHQGESAAMNFGDAADDLQPAP
jgi:hypothetical protein